MSLSEFQDAYEDIERIHGALMSAPISELSMRPPVLIDASASVVEAVDAMNEHHIGCLLVQRNGKLVGIFTERDVLTRVVFHEGNRALKVEAVMTPNPETLRASDSLAFALNRMSDGGYRHVPIVDRAGAPVGVLSVKDIVNFVVDLFPEDVLNLPPTPELGIAKDADGG
jgi:CBS domain-containing protein